MKKCFEWLFAGLCLVFIFALLCIFAAILAPFALLELLCEVIFRAFKAGRGLFRQITKGILKILLYCLDLCEKVVHRVKF